jgi:hypothetical protein
VLENCVGAPFFPGIESGGTNSSVQITSLAFAEAFRLDPAHVQPGDATKGMARPWQGDFMLCSGPQTNMENDQPSWWPAARPLGIYPFDDPTNKRLWTLGVATSMPDMVNNWHQLGFIVDTGLSYPVETEKTNVCKSCFFVTNRSEISKDEAQALIDSSQNIQDGFFVVVQGLAPSALSITTATPSQAQLNAWSPKITPSPVPSGMTITPADLALEDSSHLDNVQRVTFGYNIAFSNVSAFTSEDVLITLNAAIAGLSCFSTLDLTTRQHPYMVAGPISWLSADTRVFSRQPNGSFANVTLGNNPNDFIKAVIDSLRAAPAATAKSWFEGLPAEEVGAGQLEWSQMVNGQPIYNFAVCRIHYRSELNTAPDVRVFFRLFPAMTTSTDFQPATTYFTSGQPGTKIPLLGIVGGEVVTIPFFAEPRNPASTPLHLQTDPKNIDTLKIDAGGHETFSYYACWLDFNQPGDKRFPLQTSNPDGPFSGPNLESIADLIRGTHQCLVAEINFDLDPIPTGATTGAASPRTNVTAAPVATAAAVVERQPTARHFLGVFQFSVLVQTRREILPIIERAQTNLRRVIGTIPHENRWYPVIRRYLQQVTGKVIGLGGGQGEVGPGPHRHEHERRGDHRRFEGKVAGLRYDRFGDFEGFWLRTEDDLRQFSTRERGMESVAREAWRERLAVLVITEEHESHEPVSIVFLRAPSDD